MSHSEDILINEDADSSSVTDYEDIDQDSEFSEGDEFLLESDIEDVDNNEDPLLTFDNTDNEEIWEKWYSNIKPIPEFVFDTEHSGIKIDINDNSSPREVFDQLFTEDIVQMLVYATNAYGKELYDKPAPSTRKSPKPIFRETTAAELMKFFGLSLLLGQSTYPTIPMAFSKNSLYYRPIFGATMSGRRFLTLLRTFNCHTPINKGKVA